MTGGAVGVSWSLTPVGEEFLSVDDGEAPTSAPILVISLFNGIGGAFRAYDLCGVEVQGMASVDWHKPANRVTSRRWPQAEILEDVREVSINTVRKWMLAYPHVTQVHLWGGFPCVDLSSAKAFRSNLAGASSGLYVEILRILDLLRQVFGHRFPIFFAIENVASMDGEVIAELNAIFGVKALKLQCSDAVPISRPRLCWTNVSLARLPGIMLNEQARWTEVRAVADYPQTSQWIREDSTWEGEAAGVCFPTCMKAIPRRRPPPRPAGLSRASVDTIARWESDSFRYPPYQYKQEYVLWSPRGWRLLEASERELLHGMGYDHTALCWSASQIKADPKGYEDERCSLIGDGFSMYSFVIIAWALCFDFMPVTSYSHLVQRMGLAPGYCAPLDRICPLARKLQYGGTAGSGGSVADLTRELLRRVNHTGSDVRVSSGAILNPKAFPRQSVPACWWNWSGVFSCHWGRREHNNRLEMRAILLALKWRATHLKEVDLRFTHLTDSYVCLSIISKGRTSSVMLTSVLRRIAAWALAFGLYPVLGHVESTENPTDSASRA
eukprot:Skav211701  [mRNA]  locus=scaffold1535:220625:222286:+ [translate_table: standard]